MLLSWFRKVFSKPASRKGRRPRSRSFPLSVDYLEDRTVPTFLAPVNYAAGTAPAAIAVGDLNADGKQDIVVANNVSVGTVSTLLGNGDGTFQAPVSSRDGIAPSSIVVADFNGDGKLDVATTSTSSTLVNVLMGNGDGTFQAPVWYLLGTYANHMTVGDFNGDGHPDLAADSTGYGGTIFVLKNAGDGTFLPAQSYAAGAGAMDVRVADLNNDGKLDLVVANQVSDGTITTLLGNGDGTFQAGRSTSAGSAPYRETVGDFNHDGNEDVAVLNSYAADQMTILLGNGDGTYQGFRSYSLPTGFNDIETADFNGDGNPDLVETNGQVELGRGDGSFYAYATYAGVAANGIAIGDFNGDGSPDVAASASAGNATVLTNAANDSALLGGATGLSVSVPATVAAGTAFPVTVSAVDANGNVVPGFLGTVGLNSISPTWAAQAVSYTFTAADAGTHTIPSAAVFYGIGTYTISVTSPFLPTVTQTVTVVPGAASRFVVSAPTTTVAGTPVNISVTGYDAYGNLATGYTGTVAFRSTDAQAALPAAYTFTAADAGSHTFTATLKTAGVQTVTAADKVTGSVAGTSGNVSVSPTAASSLSLTGGGGYVATVHNVTVNARDPYGNVAPSYNGTVHLTSSDPATVVSADAALVNGVGTFQVTPNTLGAQTLTATDTTTSSIAGSETINVTPGWAARFTMTALSNTTAGVTQSFTVTALDGIGDVSTVYTGMVLVATTDPLAGSFFYTFKAADAGMHTFSITFKTAGSQSVSVTDYQNTAVTVKQSGIVITSAAPVSMSVTPVVGTTAGVSQSFTVAGRDVYGNAASAYTGTVTFASSDPQAILPATYTFTAADAGSHTFNMAFLTSGGQTFSVQDTANAANPAFNYLQKDIPITAAAMAGYTFKEPASSTAGVAFTSAVSAVDAYGNVVPNYTGTVTFSSSDAQAALPADYTFTAADAGTHTVSFTLKTAGTQTITAQDTANAATASTPAGVLVKAAAVNGLSASFPTNTTAGVAQSLTVTAIDAYGNAATGYTGTVTFSSSDVQAGLPANYTFTSKDAGVHTFSVTLKTAGTQSITVTDTANAAFTTTQSGISVSASSTAGSFVVTGFPATTAGVAQSFTVTVKDPYGNLTTGYTGTVTFSSSDVQAGLPANYVFSAADAGTHTFSATLKTAGTQSITVKDAVASTVLGSQTGIAVSAAATVASLSVSGFPATTAGVAHNVTVTARDAYGNICTGYTGTVAFSSSDVQAGLPASYTFTAADGGVHTFSATLKTAGMQSITVRDTGAFAISASQTGIAVSAAAAARFSISAPSSVTQGVGFKFTMTVLDAYGNVATGYRGQVHLSSTDAKAGTSNYTFSSSDNGVHVFSYTFPTLGSQTFTFVDTLNTALVANDTVNVVPKA